MTVPQLLFLSSVSFIMIIILRAPFVSHCLIVFILSKQSPWRTVSPSSERMNNITEIFLLKTITLLLMDHRLRYYC